LFFWVFSLIGLAAFLVCLSLVWPVLGPAGTDPATRWAILFSGAFGCAFCALGFWGIAASIAGKRGAHVDAETRRIYSAEPWKWRKDWAKGELRSLPGKAPWGLAWGALFFNLTVWALALLPGRSFNTELWGWVLLTLAKAAGVFGAIFALKELMASLRMPSMRLTLSTTPVWLGARLSGRIGLTGKPVGKLSALTLTCARRTSDRPASWKTHLLDSSFVSGETFSVDIPVPLDAPVTDSDHSWYLHVEAAGGRRLATFEVPVFRRTS
jgi:hypothetical protein